MTDNNVEERIHASTIELEDLSALELLEDVQEILTQMIAPGIQAQTTNEENAHEQVRTALNLILRAISILRREERRKHK